MLAVCSTISLIIAHVLVTLAGVSHACQFPEYALADGSQTGVRNDWRTMIRNQNAGSRKTAYTVGVLFDRNVMRTSIIDGDRVFNKPKQYTRGCLQQFEDDKYLVSHHDEGEHTQYMCMQFVKRSNDVLQLRESQLSDGRDIHLCDDEHLTLNPWPLLNRANMFQDHVDCPLSGGYDMKLHGGDSGRTCSVYDSHMRLESECMKGDGMIFYFRQKDCIPEGLKMSIRQRVFCTASWREGSYTFMLIQHEKRNHQWCLRYWSAAEGSFTMYLFKDLVCDEKRRITATKNYLRFDMKQEAPPKSLCVDDFQGCSVWNDPCKHDHFTELACAKRCGVCNSTRPARCTFPNNMRSTFVKPRTHDKVQIVLGEQRMTIPGFSDFTCTEWDHVIEPRDSQSIKKMMVTTFTNGCRPRYTCVEIAHNSPSVLRYRLSQSQVWPFLRKDNDGHRWDCSSFKYQKDPPPLNDQFRSTQFKTMVSQYTRTHVPCHLPEEKHFRVTYTKDGRKCNGTLKLKRSNRRGVIATKMVLTQMCGEDESETRQDFSCLDSLNHGYIGLRIILTEPVNKPGDVQCWLFPQKTTSKFYLMGDAECNLHTKFQIDEKIKMPLAEFTVKEKEEVTIHKDPQPKSRSSPHSSQQETANDKNRKPGYNVDGNDVTDEEIDIQEDRNVQKPEAPSSLSSESGADWLRTTASTVTLIIAVSAYLIYVHTACKAVIP